MFMPRVVVSGLSGGVGKTTVSLGLTRAFSRLGLAVRPFKKGPDYIDTAWLALASGTNAFNLDPFFQDESALRNHFACRFAGADVALVEGNRGFFDGRDLEGSTSTAEVARCIDAPVVLVVSIAKMTRTAAAIVAGCKHFPGGERIGGVVLNHCGGARHAAIAKNAVEDLAGVPVFGVLPRIGRHCAIHERRSGLVAADTCAEAQAVLDQTADMISDNVDVAAILRLARSASPLMCAATTLESYSASTVRIGVVRDAALWQYYNENLDALRRAGAELVFVSLLGDEPWPDVDGVYLGGGDLAPHAAALAANQARKSELRRLAEAGVPVYAEHSGYFYLGETFACDGQTHAMTGIFPINAKIMEKPARLGYVSVSVLADTPFYAQGLQLRAHEYHYADIVVKNETQGVLEKQAGRLRIEEPDGLVYKSVFGTSMQVFAPVAPQWASGFVAAAAAWKHARRG